MSRWLIAGLLSCAAVAYAQGPLDALRGAISRIGAPPAWAAHMEAGADAERRKDQPAAAAAYEAALAELAKAGIENELTLETLRKLFDAYPRPERLADAEAVVDRQIALAEKLYGPEDLRVADHLYTRGSAVRFQYRFAESIAALQRSAEIREKRLGAHFKVSYVLRDIALTYEWWGKYAEAEAMYLRSIAMDEKIGRGLGLATSLNELAELYVTQGRYAEAEPIYTRVLELREKGFNREHPVVARTLQDFAQLYVAQGRHAEAEPLLLRALAIDDVGWGRLNLARVYARLGRAADAEAQAKRALADDKYGPREEDVASLYRDQGRPGEAAPLLARTLVQRERDYGADHPRVGETLQELAETYQSLGRFADAEPLYRRALAVRQGALGADHPAIAEILYGIAAVDAALGRREAALAAARRASALLGARFARGEGSGRASVSERRSRAAGFERHLALLAPAAGAGDAAAVAESFELAQLARASSTADQVARMAARHAAAADGPARLAREREDALARLERLEAELVSAVVRPGTERDAARERWLREEQARQRRDMAAIDAAIEREFPQYRELMSPRPVPLDAAQALLGNDEALVVVIAAEPRSYLWAVRRNSARFVELPAGRKRLDELVRVLRRQLDLGAEDLAPVIVEPFDAGVSHELYRLTLQAAEPELAGARHLIFVPDGALQSLPPGLLITERPAGPVRPIATAAGTARNLTSLRTLSGAPGAAGGVALADLAWLVRKAAISVLPAVPALRALRQFARTPLSPEPFAGFGDPALQGSAGVARGGALAAVYSRGALADVRELRKLQPLPESADELRAIAAALGALPQAIRLREAASEKSVKATNLSRYRTLAFATHGLMAGEFGGFGEPALVLTPPEQPSELDDGLLTASEITQLKLDADWVVLSACNTAAADGTPGAEGFSGLARAFFHAGARSLLVSHWAVASEATVALTTGMFREYAGGARKAEALRRAMLAVLASSEKPAFSHPAFWAPFVIVGEGYSVLR